MSSFQFAIQCEYECECANVLLEEWLSEMQNGGKYRLYIMYEHVCMYEWQIVAEKPTKTKGAKKERCKMQSNERIKSRNETKKWENYSSGSKRSGTNTFGWASVLTMRRGESCGTCKTLMCNLVCHSRRDLLQRFVKIIAEQRSSNNSSNIAA